MTSKLQVSKSAVFQKLDYIHKNPIVSGLVTDALLCETSCFAFFILLLLATFHIAPFSSLLYSFSQKFSPFRSLLYSFLKKFSPFCSLLYPFCRYIYPFRRYIYPFG